MNVRLEEQRNKIIMVQDELDRATSPRHRRDLFKYLMRLKKELREAEMHLNGTYGKKVV